MRGVILNELEIYNKAKDKGEISEKPLETLRILTKKYFDDGMDKEQIIEKLHRFMNENYVGYKQTKWQGILEQMIKSVSKYESFKLFNVGSVSITKCEWNKILELNNEILEKIAFIMLVYQKINIIKNPKSNGWINNYISDIFREAKVGYTGDEQKKLLYKLYEQEYILMKNTCDGDSIKINYFNNESEEFINIYNFENVISYYYEYKNNEIWKECEVCKRRFKPKSNKQKYCNRCAKKISQEQKNKWKRENWNKEEK